MTAHPLRPETHSRVISSVDATRSSEPGLLWVLPDDFHSSQVKPDHIHRLIREYLKGAVRIVAHTKSGLKSACKEIEWQAQNTIEHEAAGWGFPQTAEAL